MTVRPDRRAMDTYDRVARLYPAYIALFPVSLLFVGCFSTRSWWSAILPLFAAVGLPYLLEDLVRRYGKRHQAGLFDAWGGMPTTVLLRSSAPVANRVLHSRWRARVEELVGIELPSAEDEVTDPVGSNHRYDAAVAAVRDVADRDPVLQRENRQYGFWRNLFGVHRLLAACGAVATLVSAGLLVWSVFRSIDVIVPVIAADLVVGLVWVWLGLKVIDAEAVRLQAFEYAERFMQAILR